MASLLQGRHQRAVIHKTKLIDGVTALLEHLLLLVREIKAIKIRDVLNNAVIVDGYYDRLLEGKGFLWFDVKFMISK